MINMDITSIHSFEIVHISIKLLRTQTVSINQSTRFTFFKQQVTINNMIFNNKSSNEHITCVYHNIQEIQL